MIKKIFKKAFNVLGLEIRRKSKPVTKSSMILKERISLDNFSASVTKPNYHLELAQLYFRRNRFFTAFAELKTAETLYGNRYLTKNFERDYLSKLPDIYTITHNNFFRLNSLKEEIQKKVLEKGLINPSVLDVGGGEGILAAFIPNINYCLAEPSVNGINGFDIPFNDDSFDLVVSCHVLEHIPLDQRDAFLDQLLRKSRTGLILLNPIEVEGTFPEERMQLFVDVINADWAKEHLECKLPTVQNIKDYAEKRNLIFEYSPNSSITMTLPLVFMDHLSKHFPPGKYRKINQFLNTKFTSIATSEKYPTAGMFFLGKKL